MLDEPNFWTTTNQTANNQSTEKKPLPSCISARTWRAGDRPASGWLEHFDVYFKCQNFFKSFRMLTSRIRNRLISDWFHKRLNTGATWNCRFRMNPTTTENFSALVHKSICWFIYFICFFFFCLFYFFFSGNKHLLNNEKSTRRTAWGQWHLPQQRIQRPSH